MTFTYRKPWCLPCKYHDARSRIIDDSVFVPSVDIEQLAVKDCNAMRFTLTTDKTTVSYATLREAYTAFEAALYDTTVVTAMLLCSDAYEPLATFDRRSTIVSEGERIMYVIKQ